MSRLLELAEGLESAVTVLPDARLRDECEAVAKELRQLAGPAPENTIVNSHALEQMEPSRQVIDATGDVWFKLPDGRWSFKNATTSSAAHLVQVFGPIRTYRSVPK